MKPIPTLTLLLTLLSSLALADVRTLDWLDLVPQTQVEAVLAERNANYHDLEAMTEQMIEEAKARIEGLQRSPQLVTELDQQRIRIPGYVVPLEFGDDEVIRELLLVPYFGACIHVPPPPPNQIIHVRYPQGLSADALYDPFWVEGVLSIQGYDSELGSAGYSMTAERIELYTQ
ncbi:DUF3299 domain-containing protein [Aestuariirhabdus litorea]|uniref:DUF3299 domain-containing protein n=1 Tax=Aestuariirhabdus litorea TaxID=2528527 RepID=A0A3P3VN15_9GAMM|nr:DUF3299 domain-containing protein [Aestuariirhabdus litorea]RRJ84152.1 DUF3299 domain-containing protein [Aestuariirhabdus litorea]RWW97372.1 DUF3299 domain-containing protein [Endozoicomonadaceae bacterium GTF-13]